MFSIHYPIVAVFVLIGGLLPSFNPLCQAENLIVNGGFNQSGQGEWDIGYPNGHFTSQYLARPEVNDVPGYLGDDGSYTIGGNPSLNHQDFRVMTSDQGGDGSMMIVNGSSHEDIAVWASEAIDVEAHAIYQFSGYVTNVNARRSWEDWRSTQTIIGAAISTDGGGSWVSLGILADLRVVAEPDDWHRFTVDWSSPFEGSVMLRILDFQTAPFGNDFALDTLQFKVIPEPSAYTLLTIMAMALMYRRYTLRTTS